jgi:hypothetical protein
VAHEMLTHPEAIAIPAVTAITVRYSVRWKASRRRQRKPAPLPGDAYMPRAVVTGSGKPARKRRTTAPVTTYIDPNRLNKLIGPTNGGNPDA